MIDQETQKVKLILDGKAGIVGSNLTADDAESAVKLTEQASRKANCEAFRQWLMQFECREDVIETCLQKFVAFQPSRTAIQNIIDEMGKQLEQPEDVCSLERFRDNDWPFDWQRPGRGSLQKHRETIVLF
ncbi:MAG: hypothetical protein FWH27_01595 [Planctomycetaceae bacterium]|nr:hypothetical protein [Planctomycetaceae bacterium]